MLPSKSKISIISCESGKYLAKKVVTWLCKKTKYSVHLIETKETVFANTEIKTELNESIRGRDVYIIQDCENHTNGMSTDQNLRALYTTIDASRRCDAKRITAIIPSYPYARQDKQNGRDGITAARVALELEGDLGADHLITLDLHNSAIQGFFRKAKIDNLKGGHVILPYLKKLIKNTENTVIMPTDLGGAKRANYFAQSLHTEIAFSYKERNYNIPNSVDKIEILGEVEGKDIFIIDDMIDTGGTLIKSIVRAKQKGAKSISAVCTLALLNGDATKKFSKLYKDGIIQSVIGTDATFHSKKFLKENPWFKELSVSNYLSETILNIHKGKSLSELLS